MKEDFDLVDTNRLSFAISLVEASLAMFFVESFFWQSSHWLELTPFPRIDLELWFFLYPRAPWSPPEALKNTRAEDILLMTFIMFFLFCY